MAKWPEKQFLIFNFLECFIMLRTKLIIFCFPNPQFPTFSSNIFITGIRPHRFLPVLHQHHGWPALRTTGRHGYQRRPCSSGWFRQPLRQGVQVLTVEGTPVPLCSMQRAIGWFVLLWATSSQIGREKWMEDLGSYARGDLCIFCKVALRGNYTPNQNWVFCMLSPNYQHFLWKMILSLSKLFWETQKWD